MYFKKNYEIQDLSNLLWSGAKDRWNDATDEQRQQVWDRIEDFFYDSENNPPTTTEINDIIWFECDDIFFPNENDDDDDETDE